MKVLWVLPAPKESHSPLTGAASSEPDSESSAVRPGAKIVAADAGAAPRMMKLAAKSSRVNDERVASIRKLDKVPPPRGVGRVRQIEGESCGR